MHSTAAGAIAPVDPKRLPEYAPTTPSDFSRPENRAAFDAALAAVRAQLGREYPIVIGGESIDADADILRAGERDETGLGMTHQRLAHRATAPGDEVEDSGG